jgi:hypothetical protein
MPLPDVQTLDNNDQVAAQQNPAFMQEPITSPSQVPAPQIAVPGSSSVSPIQTGQFAYGKAQGSPFSQDFLSKVYGPGPNTRTPGNLNTIDYNVAKTGTDRYPQFNPEGDNEEIYGLNQNPFKQLANGVIKGAGGFAGAFAEGMMSIPDTINALANGKFSNLYNDPVADATSKWQANMENALPNYITHAQENRNFLLNAIPFSGGAANFWGNTFIKNLGPMAGAVASTLAQAALITAATEGAGDIPFLTEKFGRASLWLNRVMTSASNALTEGNAALDQVASVSKTAELLNQATALGRTGEQILDLQKIQALSEGMRVRDAGQYLVNLYTTGRTMSAQGARQQYDTMKESLTAEYIQKNGYQPVGGELQKIEDTAMAAGNTKFAMDTALMMIQENIALDNILSFGGAAKGKYVSEAQRALGTDLGNVAFKKGTNTLEYQAPTGLFNKIGKVLTPLAPSALSAGIVGGAFYGTQVATDNFYHEKYDGKIKGTLTDAVDSLGKGMTAQFGTKQGLEQGFVGLLMGALLGLGSKALEKITLPEGYDSAKVREAAINAMNQETTSGFMKNNFESAAKTLSNSEKMKAANERGDVFEYDNIKHNEFVNYAINHAKNNMPEVGLEKLKMLKELDTENFVKQFNMEDTPENRKLASDYTDNLMREYQNIIKSRDLISDTFRNPYDRNEKTEDGVSKNKYEVFENWKDTLTNYASVARNVADRVRTIQKSASDLYSLATPDDLRTLTNPTKLRAYNDSLKATAKELSDSLEADTSVGRAADREKLNYINKMTGEVDAVLAKHNPDNIHQAYSDMEDLQTFQKLMDWRASGGDPNYVPELEVPKESLAHLAGYGGDLNKLDILKQQADHAYDILSTEKGFKTFYDAEVSRFKKAAAEQPKPQAAAAGLGAGTAQSKATSPEDVTITHPTSGETKLFKKGDEVYIPQKSGNPTKATIDSVNPDGSVNVVYKDGSQGVVPATTFFKPKTTTAKTTVKTKAKAPTPDSPPPATKEPTAPTETEEPKDSAPDILIGPKSGSTPRYQVPDLPDNNYHRRLQSFLEDMGSSDPKVFNPEHRGNMYIQFVTPNTQEALGFPKDWIQSTGGDANTIRMVHVIHDASGTYYATSKGDKGKKVGEPGMTGAEAIYSMARTSDLKLADGRPRYTNKTKVNMEDIAKQWEVARQHILSKKTPDLIPQKFTVSRGIADTNIGVRNSVVKVGLINESDLGKPIVAMGTNSEVYIEPLEDDSIGATRTGIPVKNGVPFLNHGLSLTFLNNHRFNVEQAASLFDLLKFHSDATKPEEDQEAALKHIKERIYTLLADSQVERKPNTIAIQDDQLWLGQDPKGIPYNPEAIQDNMQRIMDFLTEKAFNNVDNLQLKNLLNKAKDNDPDALIYRTYAVKDGKLVVDKEFPTYNHYLLSDANGHTPILTTNVQVPQNGEPIFKNKYPTLRDFEFKPAPVQEKPAVVATEAQEPSVRPVRGKYTETPADQPHSLRYYEYTPIVNEKGQEIRVDTSKPFGYRIGSEDAELKTPKNPAGVEALINDLISKDIIPQDETNTSADDLSFLGNPDIKPDAGPQYSYTNILPNNYEKIDLEKEIANIRADLGEDFPIHVLDHVIKVTNGGLAYGAFYNNAVYIWNDAVKGTGYHEAFEKVFNQFLTGKEQADLYYEFQNRAGEFTTFHGEKKKYEDASFKEAKEKIADEFAEFREGRGDVPPKQKSFFRRLLDFIKRIIFGVTHKINDLFDRINRGEYRNFSSKGEDDATRPAQYKEDDGLSGFSEPVIQDLMQGMTVKMMNLIYGKNRDLLQAMDTGGKRSAKDLYTELFNDMKSYYTDNVGGNTLAAIYNEKFIAAQKAGDTFSMTQIKNDVTAIRGMWAAIQAKWPEIVAKHKETLRPLNITFSVDSEGNESLDDIEDYTQEEDRNPNEYMRDDMTFDSKKAAAAPIKLTYSTVPLSERAPNGELIYKLDNSLVKLPKLANYASLWNYTLFQSANVNGLFDIYKKLADVAMGNKSVDPNLQRIINRLQMTDEKGNFTGFQGKELPDVRYLLQFESAFFVNKPDFARQYVTDGKVHFYNATLNNKAEQQVQTWLANMKSSTGVKAQKDKYVFKKPDLKSDHLDFARTLGINFPNKLFNKMSAGTQKMIREHIGAIRSQVMKLADNGTQFGFVSGETIDIKTRLASLADLYAAFVTGDDTQSQHLNLDNKPTSSFIRNNALSLILNDANNSKDLTDFYTKQPAFHPKTGDIFRRDSVVINNIMFDKDGKFLKPVSLTVVEGRQESGKSLPTSKLTLYERMLYQFNNNLMGVYYTLVPADGKNEYGSNPGRFISPSAFFSENKGSAFAKFYQIMGNYLNTEIALAKDFATNPTRNNLVNLNKKAAGGRVRGNSLRFFLDILPKEMVDAIHSEVIDGGGHIELKDVVEPGEINEALHKFITDKAKATINSLVKGQIFEYNSENKTFVLNGVDDDFLYEYPAKKERGKRHYSTDLTLDIATYREMNFVIGTIEQHKLYVGDPAQYDNDELKRNKSFLGGVEPIHVDNEAGEVGLNGILDKLLNLAHGKIKLEAKDPGFTPFKNYANVLTLHDVKVESSSMPMLNKVLGEKVAKPYGNTDEADASVIHHPVHYREVMYKSGGRFNDAQEADWQRHFAETRLDKAAAGKYKYTNPELEKADREVLNSQPFPNFDVTYPVLKLKAAGSSFENGTSVEHINKAAWAMQMRSWTKGTQMEDIYDAMEATGADYIMVQSAHKIGTSEDSLVPLYKADGTINIEGIKKAQLQQIPHTILGIQVEQKTKGNTVTQGSQLRALATAGLYSDSVPVDFIENNKGDVQNAKLNWDKLSPKEKEASSPVHKAALEHKEALEQLIIKKTELAMNKLGFMEDGAGVISVPDKTKAGKFIRSEVTRREMSDNIKKGIMVDPATGEFMSPLESSVSYKPIRDIIYSILDKGVIRPKMNGGQLTHQAPTGWERGPRKVLENGKLASSDLAFYNQGEDGKTTHAEFLIPNLFGKVVRDRLQATHNFKSEAALNQHLFDHLMKTNEGRKLLELVGFRIPTQADNSIEIGRAKGFLSAQAGQRIIGPSELTTKAGLDFDVDKMNTYLRNFWIDKQGYPHLIKLERLNTNDDQALKDYYERVYRADRDEYDKYQKNDIYKFVDQALSEDLEGETDEPDYVPDLDTFLKDAKGKDYWQYNSVKALENNYMDKIEALMRLPEKFKTLVTPNDATETKNLSKEITKLLHPEGTESMGMYGSIIDSQYMDRKRDAFITSKGGVGVAAVSNTGHALAQLGPLVYHGDFDLRFPHNEIDGNVSLSAVKAADGSNILNAISQTIDGFVDVAKSEFLAEMGINNNTAKNWLLFLRSGVNKETAALFMNQPAVLKYLELKGIHDNVSNINKAVKPMSITKLFGETSKIFGGQVYRPTWAKNKKNIKPAKYTNTEMREMMDKYNRGVVEDNINKLSPEQNQRQLQILDDYLKYDSVAWNLFHYQQGFNWATDRGADPNMTRRKEVQYQKAKDLPMSDVDHLMDKTFVGVAKEQLLKLEDGIRELFPIQRGEADKVLTQYTNQIMKIRGISKFDFPKIMMKVEGLLLDSVIQSKTSIQGNPLYTYITPLMIGPNSIARYVQGLIDHPDPKISQNLFIQSIRTHIDTREGYPDSIELLEKPRDPYTSNRLTAALRDLRDDHGSFVTVNTIKKSTAQIFKGMLFAGILQSGTRSGPRSWTTLLPNEDYGPLVKQATEQIDSSVRDFYSNGEAYKSLWDDDKLVPIIPKQFIEDEKDPTRLIEVSREFKNQKFREALNTEKPVSIMQLPWFTYRDKPYVKTVEMPKKDKDGHFTDKVVRLYRRVDVYNDDPAIIVKKTTNAFKKVVDEDMVLYSEVNKKGAPNLSELSSYSHSVLPSNPYVEEVSDEKIIDAVFEANIPNKLPEEYTRHSDPLQYEGDEVIETGEEIGDEEAPAQDNEIKDLEDKGIIKRDCK